MRPRLNHFTAGRRDAPCRTFTRDGQVSYAYARSPVLRLNEKRRSDVQIRLLLVRVPVYHEIDSWNLRRDSSSDGIVARRLVQPGVHSDDHYAGACRPRLTNSFSHTRKDVVNGDASFHVLGV